MKYTLEEKKELKRTVGEIAVSYVVWDGEDWATPKQFNEKYGITNGVDEMLVKDSDKAHWMVKVFQSSEVLAEREVCAQIAENADLVGFPQLSIDSRESEVEIILAIVGAEIAKKIRESK